MSPHPARPERFEALGPLFVAAIDKAVDLRWERAMATAADAEGDTLDERVASITAAFSRELTATGAVAGGTAAVPGLGTTAAVASNAGEVGWFTLRVVDMILALAAVHGHSGATVEQRRAWLLSILAFGDDASSQFGSIAATITRTGIGAKTTEVVTSEWLSTINRTIAKTVVKRWGTRRSAVVLGRLLPFGIGAAVGGTSNYAAVRLISRQADGFFRTLPPVLGRELPPA